MGQFLYRVLLHHAFMHFILVWEYLITNTFLHRTEKVRLDLAVYTLVRVILNYSSVTL